MELSERKRRILRAVVDDYIRTAEPVGSSYILNQHKFGISSATIRNEMADLEEQGYLDKPHTSAGRVPSLLGYRVYVDELMQQYTLTMREIALMREALSKRYLELGNIVNDISNTISHLTNLTTLVSTPVAKANRLKSIRFVPIDDVSFVMLLVTSEGVVKNTTIRAKTPVDAQILERLGNYLNNVFSDTELSSITKEALDSQKEMIPMADDLITPIFDYLYRATHALSGFDVIHCGENSIFDYPEFQSVERTKGFFELLRHMDKDIIQSALSESSGTVSILMGDDNPRLKELGLSVVLSKYSIDGKGNGGIAIIGPARMDYPRVVAMLDFLSDNLHKYLNDSEE